MPALTRRVCGGDTYSRNTRLLCLTDVKTSNDRKKAVKRRRICPSPNVAALLTILKPQNPGCGLSDLLPRPAHPPCQIGRMILTLIWTPTFQFRLLLESLKDNSLFLSRHSTCPSQHCPKRILEAVLHPLQTLRALLHQKLFHQRHVKLLPHHLGLLFLYRPTIPLPHRPFAIHPRDFPLTNHGAFLAPVILFTSLPWTFH